MATGELKSYGILRGSLQSDVKVSGSVTLPKAGDLLYDEYEGEYIVTPQPWDEIVLETGNKILRDNVTVEVIPYYETSNLSGGSTVYIGGN